MPKQSIDKHILLVDDHALFRAGIRLILQSKIDASITEIEKISDAAMVDIDIDVILLDIYMPSLNGIDGMTILQDHWPNARIMLLSALSNHEDINRALGLGASCFLNKNTDPTIICKTVESLLHHRLHNENRSNAHLSPSVITDSKAILSTRLLEVLALIAEGHNNKHIAHQLSLSENTVRNHIAALMDHFSVNNRTKIILAAQQAGYLSKQD